MRLGIAGLGVSPALPSETAAVPARSGGRCAVAISPEIRFGKHGAPGAIIFILKALREVLYY